MCFSCFSGLFVFKIKRIGVRNLLLYRNLRSQIHKFVVVVFVGDIESISALLNDTRRTEVSTLSPFVNTDIENFLLKKFRNSFLSLDLLSLYESSTTYFYSSISVYLSVFVWSVGRFLG